ncbi:MAG: glutamate 5-kinase [Bacteroidales bacterium]|nr:glutamate 5-kinase [Bacteroidales bacterium]
MKNNNYRFQRVAIKVGSNVLTQKDGTLDLYRINALVEQIALLHKAGVEIILISSGAVASGRSVIKAKGKLDAVSARQLFSAVGQAKLINHYYELFQKHDIACGQVLTTKESLGTRRHYLNQKNCISVMLENKVIPILNENDTISVTELMFTDNDELSGMAAAMMHAEALIILSNIDGIYNGNPNDPSSEVIRKVYPEKDDLERYIQAERSSFGRGGMLTKTNIASKVAKEGISVFIANGKKDDILPDLLQKNSTALCTEFVAAKERVSNMKKWLAHSEGFAKGEIHINTCAEEALLSSKAASLLPVGVTKVSGEFEKDDIVRVINSKGESIGLGRVRYDSSKSAELAGKHGKKPLIHYDYLYLE